MKLVNEVLFFVQFIAVILVVLDVQRTDPMKLLQGHDVANRTISVRVRGKGEICNFQTLATFANNAVVEISCTEKAITDVMLVGVSDNEIP